jgi:hypothetical protein
MNSLLAASAVDGSVFLKSGRKRNLEEAEKNAQGRELTTFATQQ